MSERSQQRCNLKGDGYKALGSSETVAKKAKIGSDGSLGLNQGLSSIEESAIADAKAKSEDVSSASTQHEKQNGLVRRMAARYNQLDAAVKRDMLKKATELRGRKKGVINDKQLQPRQGVKEIQKVSQEDTDMQRPSFDVKEIQKVSQVDQDIQQLSQDVKEIKNALKWHDLESNKKTLQKKLTRVAEQEVGSLKDMIASLSEDQEQLATLAGEWLTSRKA